MNMSKYVLLKKGLIDKGKLVPNDKYLDLVDQEKDYYVSTYYFNDEHLKRFNEYGTVKGIRDVITNKIWFDFDNKDNPDLAKTDAIELCERLQKTPILSKDIEIYFSSNKGFHVIVSLKRNLIPEQVASICLNKFGKGLNTLDASVYDPVQILRVQGTKNPKSGLYKIPITITELKNLTMSEIKSKATTLDNVNPDEFNWEPTDLPEEMFEMPKIEKTKKTYVSEETTKPSNWRACKWNILQGNFKSGERHAAMMVLASTARAMGFDKTTAYHFCKSAIEKQAEKHGQDKFPKEELFKNIIEDSIYTDSWNGGQYTCKKPGFLQTYCQSLGDHGCSASDKDEGENLVHIDDTFGMFKSYAQNIDKITIKTGIPALDDNLRITVGMSIGLVAAPGVGKTSMALQMLNYMSKSGEKSIFFSYDMFHALVFQKLIQKHFNMHPDEIFERFQKGDTKFETEVLELIKKEYGNVDFCFTQGQTMEDISRTIKESETKSGKKVRFVVVDYNELVSSPYSDATASSAFIAQKMREIAISNECCVFSLFQPTKMSGKPSDEISSYRSAKGSSAIEQSVSIMLGMNRPGFDPRHPEDDKFITINCLKNRMGSTFCLDLHWDGLRGTMRDLTEEEEQELKTIRQRKFDEEAKNKKEWS